MDDLMACSHLVPASDDALNDNRREVMDDIDSPYLQCLLAAIAGDDGGVMCAGDASAFAELNINRRSHEA